LIGFLNKLIHGNLYDIRLKLLHRENAFDRLKLPYRLIAGRWGMSCHDDMMEVMWLVGSTVQNPDIRPIFGKPARTSGQGPKERTCPGNPDVW